MRKTWLEGNPRELRPNPSWKDLTNTPNMYAGWLSIKKGKAHGRIIGGSNKSLIQLLHTPYQPMLENSILVFESNKMNKKQIHRALMQLRIHGVFKKISGLLMGYCYQSDNLKIEGNERSIKDLVLEVTKGYDFPIMHIGEFGHNVENIVLPIGAKMKMDAGKLELEIEGKVVK
jgi:muramoyltetrapeptide carboxypeptidase